MMPEQLSSWAATAQLHETFFGNNQLSPEELALSGVRAVVGSTSSKTIRRIETNGEIDGRKAHQTLSRDHADNFHFSTTFLEYRGEHVQSDIRPGSPPEAFKVIEASLFMQALLKIIAERG